MTLHHVRAGEGEPIVLVHGIGASVRVWEPVIPLLARDHEVLAVDMPGMGRSAPLDRATKATGWNLAAAVADFCESLGLVRPHAVGNSLGGWVALEMARAGRARTVTALSPAGLWRKTLGPPPPTRAIARRLRPLVLASLAVPQVRRRAVASNFAQPDRVPAEVARALIADWIDAPGYDAANHEMRSARIEDLHEITVPVTIAWGERDTLVGPPKPERRPPGAEFVVLRGCGHVPTWDDPEQVVGVIRATAARAPS